MLSPVCLGFAVKPQSHQLLNEHILVGVVVVLYALFKCFDWDLSLETVLVQRFGVYRHISLPSYPPSSVSHRSVRFRREKNVSPRGPPSSFTCHWKRAHHHQVEGAGQHHISLSCTVPLSRNLHFITDLSCIFFASSPEYKSLSRSWHSSSHKSDLKSGFSRLLTCQT